MNRLGMSPGLLSRIVLDLRGQPATAHPDGILTHLSFGEKPNSRLSLQQKERFAAIRSELAGIFPSAHFHFGNSSAIWNRRHWDLDRLSDVVRPGISLYGIPPWPGAAAKGIEPVMRLQASVIAVRRLKRGECIGYGATPAIATTEKRKGSQESVTVAILAAGYADGLKRFLSHQGHAWISREDGSGGAPGRFIGIVSMDLCSVTCPPGTKVGDWAELIGPNVEPWTQAKTAGTIPYELLTSVSSRVQRIYD
jgi:alanine racemase